MHKAKIFKNGQSQAVRLPKEFRFQGTEVNISKLGHAVVLQPLLHTWLDVYKEMKPVENFMEDYQNPLMDKRESL